ncbi:hypothetical protein C8J56DRAFT_770228, partial [Mycena floridula]
LEGIESEDWRALVQEWKTWEEGFGFVQAGHDGRILGGAKVRPEQVEWWTKRKRVPTPHIANAAAFRKKWWSWWKLLNPDWHTSNEDGTLKQEGEGPWDSLMVSGMNGLLSPLMCLRWWFSAEVETVNAWEEAVAEMRWVLQSMTDSRSVSRGEPARKKPLCLAVLAALNNCEVLALEAATIRGDKS